MKYDPRTHRPELAVACPKCLVPPGRECISVLHPGPLVTRFYLSHKKRRNAQILGPRVLSR